MTVKVTKDALNLREKLSELDKPSGIAGQDILKADTPQEVFNYIGAGRRNLIINGAMQVSQRGTSFTGLGEGDSGYTLDRFQWREGGTTAAVYTVEQSTDAPSGFASSLKATVTTAGTDSSGNNRITTGLEAQDLQHIGFGTSDAKPLTLSFWVKSSITGQYAVNLYRPDNTTRGVAITYTIDSANTWEHKVISVPADTSQTVDNNTESGMDISWFMNATSNYQSATGYPWVNYNSTMYAKGQEAQVGQTSGATWQITGVQLEVGSVATPFEHRSFGEELALCQRYYERLGFTTGYPAIGMGAGKTSTFVQANAAFKAQKRTAPTVTISSPTSFVCYDSAARFATVVTGAGVYVNNASIGLNITASSITAGNAYYVYLENNASAGIELDAEL